MQHGCLTTKSQQRRYNVWRFGWSEKCPLGRHVNCKKITGTIEEYPDAEFARNAISGLITEVKPTIGSTRMVVVKSPSFLSSVESFISRPVPHLELSSVQAPWPVVLHGAQPTGVATTPPPSL